MGQSTFFLQHLNMLRRVLKEDNACSHQYYKQCGIIHASAAAVGSQILTHPGLPANSKMMLTNINDILRLKTNSKHVSLLTSTHSSCSQE